LRAARNDLNRHFMDQPVDTNSLDKKTVILRGLKGQCPKCGQSPLFASYLKPVEACSACGERWVDIRADDAPAWASILIAGHILAPFFHPLSFKSGLSTPVASAILVFAGIGICLTALPRMKGLFMALIWRNGAPMS